MSVVLLRNGPCHLHVRAGGHLRVRLRVRPIRRGHGAEPVRRRSLCRGLLCRHRSLFSRVRVRPLLRFRVDRPQLLCDRLERRALGWNLIPALSSQLPPCNRGGLARRPRGALAFIAPHRNDRRPDFRNRSRAFVAFIWTLPRQELPKDHPVPENTAAILSAVPAERPVAVGLSLAFSCSKTIKVFIEAGR